jgi:hypothetical protein
VERREKLRSGLRKVHARHEKLCGAKVGEIRRGWVMPGQNESSALGTKPLRERERERERAVWMRLRQSGRGWRVTSWGSKDFGFFWRERRWEAVDEH